MGIVSGAIEGLGRAGVQAGLQLQQQFGAEELLKMRTDAEKELQASMQKFQTGRDATIEGYASSREIRQDTRADARQGAAFKHSETLQASGQDFNLKLANQTEKNAIERQKAVLASQEKIAGSQSALQRELHGPQMELAREQLRNTQAVSILRSAYAAAIESGNNEAIKSLPKRIEALGYSGDAKDVSGLISVAATASKLASAVDASDSDKKLYGNIAKAVLSKVLGEKDVTSSAAIPSQAIQDDFKKRASDPKARAAFESQYPGWAEKVSPTAPPPPPPSNTVGGGVVNKEVSGSANLSLMPEWRLNQLIKGGNQNAAAEIERRKKALQDLIDSAPPED